MLGKTSSLPLKRENSYVKVNRMFAENLTGFVFFIWVSPIFFFLHSNFWALREPSPCCSRLKTAAIRWQLWTFHLPTISQWSESSVCLSKTFSVFNLNCSSGCLSLAQPADLVSSHRVGFHKMWEILMKGIFGETGLLLQSLNIRTYRGCMRLKASDKSSTSGFTHFRLPTWEERATDTLRESNEIRATEFQAWKRLDLYLKSLLWQTYCKWLVSM